VTKPATAGMENKLGIVIQGHMDIVAQKDNNLEHNFETDPIDAYVDGDWVTARGTTLGSDNGIGVSMGLAVLESTDLVHPKIECLFTINEECGMSGALGLQPGYLTGDWLINIDTEEEGELYVGCAGGKDIVVNIPVVYQAPTENWTALSLVVGGLKGGHSGVDIHLGRANANKINNTFLLKALDIGGISVASFDGGSLRNAIPRDARTVIVVDPAKLSEFENLAASLSEQLTQQYGAVDTSIKITLEAASMPSQVIKDGYLVNIVKAIEECPNGVDSWIAEIPDVVETSNNLARVVSNGDEIRIEISARSSVGSERDRLSNDIKDLFEKHGANVEFGNEYPGWKPEMKSSLLQLMKQQFKDLFKKEPGIKVIHAGLECGVLGAVYPHWEMISFGPTITGAHSPDERCNIADVKKVWEYLVQVLKNIPEKK
jgi:dipeptidase D